ncbi:30S ribosomal protein S3 [Candidatus Liberibacter sp.]|uniref:30S ribosomal protein S3 n=1 Tax=Candidatus Liberibacter sp. TaxID=34022 RepID=UPI0015F43C74|nr:30S ribosomal protein S3 [Candidatus Liberibacter sp.]MBA5724535.1 30S ribosomal protein S3 [Candidatus Liberibacter sp.]
MGQKVNPIIFRLGVNRTWDSRWFARRGSDYASLLHEDLAMRKYLQKDLKQAGISKILIERPHMKCRIIIHSARPAFIIGKKGVDIERIRKKLSGMTSSEVHLNIVEVSKPEINATLIAQSVAQQLEKRVVFRRAMKRAVQSAMRFGVDGIKIICAGRLNGLELSRTEWYLEGRVSLQTLRADIDYGSAEARTVYGICGVKVYVCNGEILEHDSMASSQRALEKDNQGGNARRRDREKS